MRERSRSLPLYSQYKSPKWNCGQGGEEPGLVRWTLLHFVHFKDKINMWTKEKSKGSLHMNILPFSPGCF